MGRAAHGKKTANGKNPGTPMVTEEGAGAGQPMDVLYFSRKD